MRVGGTEPSEDVRRWLNSAKVNYKKKKKNQERRSMGEIKSLAPVISADDVKSAPFSNWPYNSVTFCKRFHCVGEGAV